MIDIKQMCKLVSEDAMVTGDNAIAGEMSSGILKTTGLTTGDVLGKDCNHKKDGYMGKKCNHIPKPLKLSTDGTIRKKKKIPYEKGMTIINDAEFDRDTILAIHKIPERKILAFIKDNYDEVDGAIYIQSIAYNFASKTYFIKFDDAIDDKFKYVSAEFDGKQFLTSDDLNVYDSDGMKKQFEKIMYMKGNNKNNVGSDSWNLWIMWGND